MICNECWIFKNRDCEYAVGEQSCKVLNRLTKLACNRANNKPDDLNITISQHRSRDAWICTLPAEEVGFIILGWRDGVDNIEAANFLEYTDIRELTYEDVKEFVEYTKMEINDV